MISKEQHKFLFKILNSYKVNKFSTKHVHNPKIIIITRLYIGNNRFEIHLYKGTISLEIQRYGIILLLIEYNPISDNMTLLFNDNEHCSEIVYRINDVSEILEEDGYFQQSLVQNLPLEYNDFCKMMDDITTIKNSMLERFELTEQVCDND